MADCEHLHRVYADLRQPCPMCGEDDFRHLRPAANGGSRAIPPDPINHLLHLGLCIITGGLWIFVYGIILVNSGMQQRSYQRYLTLQR